MTTSLRSSRSSLPWLLLSSAGVCYAAYDLVLWITAWQASHGDFQAARSTFSAHMLFATPTQESAAALVCAGVGLAGAMLALRGNPGRGRLVARALAALAGALLLVTLWTLL